MALLFAECIYIYIVPFRADHMALAGIQCQLTHAALLLFQFTALSLLLQKRKRILLVLCQNSKKNSEILVWTLEGDNFETRSMNCVGEVLPRHQVRMEAGMWRSFTKVQRAKGKASGESGVHGLRDTEDKKWKVRARHTMWKLEKVASV